MSDREKIVDAMTKICGSREEAERQIALLREAGYAPMPVEPSSEQFDIAMLDIEDRRGPQRESKQVFREFYHAAIRAGWRDE